MAYLVTDNAATTLAASITNSPSVTTLTLTDASKFPIINHGGTGSDYTYVTLYDSSGNIEVVKVTRRDNGSNNATIVRGTAMGIANWTDSTCRSWALTTTGVACRLIAQTVNEISASALSAQSSATAASASAALAIPLTQKAAANGVASLDANGKVVQTALQADNATNATNVTGTTAIANGGTGATTAASARTNLGLGSAATLTAGTAANNVVQLDSNAKLPAVDGSAVVDVKRSFTTQQTPKSGTLTDGATIDWNGDVHGQVVAVTLGGNRTMNAPTNIQQYALYMLRVTQDATGSRSITWNAAYKFGGSGAPVLTSTAGKTDWLSFVGGSGNTLEYLGARKDAV